jgi:hypothetical protein
VSRVEVRIDVLVGRGLTRITRRRCLRNKVKVERSGHTNFTLNDISSSSSMKHLHESTAANVPVICQRAAAPDVSLLVAFPVSY